MTNREYLQQTLGKFNVAPEEIDLVLINQGLNGDEYVDVPAARLALYEEFATLLPIAEISEGGFSIRWNMAAIKLWYSNLARQLGRPDIFDDRDDTVQDMSFMM